MAELTRKPLRHAGSSSRPPPSMSQSSPNVSLMGEHINRSLGLLEQATGVGRTPRTPSLPVRNREMRTPQDTIMDYTLTTPTLPLRRVNFDESKSFMSPAQDKMLFTPSEKLTTSLMETSRNLPGQSILTTPTLYRWTPSQALAEQSLLSTPGTSMNVTKFEHVNLLVETDPGAAATEGLYEDFHESFRMHRSSTEVFPLVRKYEELCHEQVLLLHKLTQRIIPGEHKFVKTKEVLEQLEKEKCTWRLLASLYQDRQASLEDMGDEGFQPRIKSRNRSEKEIIVDLYEVNGDVRQAQIIVDWLESCASDQAEFDKEKVEYYSQSVCWENSLHHLQQRANGVASLPRNHVTSLDPDAATRENKNLADLDKDDEVRLLRDVFKCIRSGQLEEAQRLCKKCSQSWRAATLEGWRQHHDPNVRNGVGAYVGLARANGSPFCPECHVTVTPESTQKHLLDSSGSYWQLRALCGPRRSNGVITDIGLDGNRELEPVEGNPYRDVWKRVCWRMAEEERYHQYERAMYAALSGNLRELLPVCSTWADYLWAYFKVMVDQKVEQEVRDNLTLPRSIEPLPPNFDQKQLNLQNIFHELQATPHQNVELEAKEKHHIVQKYMILDDLDALTEEMVDWICNSSEKLGSHIIRFMAHFVLVVRSLGLQTREEITVRIIEEFVDDLIEARRTEMVAIYVAQLPPSLQVAYYAKFLEGISEPDEQQHCLQLAEEAGLDVAAITKTVVENIRTGPDSALTDVLPADSLEAVTSEDDQKKIEAINWLVFDTSQRAEALKQSNALIRTFLELKKHDAAREVFQKVPQDSVDVVLRNWQAAAGSQSLPPEQDNAIKEHLCIKSYLDALSAFNDWFDHYHNKRPVRPSQPASASFHERVRIEHQVREFEMEMEKWKQSSLIMTKTVRDTIYNVLLFLDGGWMVDPQPALEVDELRQDQMTRLREKCIPLLCTLLLQVLHTGGLYRECLTLADEIASDEQQLYKVFKKDELKQFLLKLKESSSCLLDQDLDALGYEL